MSSSSSNAVRVAYIKETVYGETPLAGDFKTARFTRDGLSGTPDTVQSQQIRVDRMSSGQVVTGLTVGGNLGFELAKEHTIDDFLSSAMMDTWDVLAPITVDLNFDSSAKELERALGSWITDGLVVGDYITPAGFVAAKNNVPMMIAEIVSATVVRVVTPQGVVSEVGAGTSFKRADKLVIGTEKISFSMEKKFTDLTNKGINYRGMIVNSAELDVGFGKLITGSFGFMGNDYQTAAIAGDFLTNGRAIGPAATTQTLNGSVDMPFLASSAIGVLDDSDFALQGVNLKLNNNLTPQNVIGNIAPRDYSAGTANIEVGLSAYLNDDSWSLLGNKLTQDPFALGFVVKNNGGWYGFYIPAVQVSFDDPSSGGQNQDVMLDMKGMAKVADDGSSALVIYRS